MTAKALQKTPSGVLGLDEILDGGLPQGRPTLLCGGAGCGKTLLGMQFLVRGALDHGEPGVFVAFEEHIEDLRANVASLGFDLSDLEKRKLLGIEHIQIDPTRIVEAGEYDLDALFLRIGLAIESVGAKRIVIDTLETLFGGLSNYGVIRAELRRLFNWLKESGVTAIITGERGDGALTRHGLEEYVSDCVILLDHRVVHQISTRRLRVVKYRGSSHRTNEYPFLIDANGITVMPITSASLGHEVSSARISTGVAALDEMLDGGGYYQGSTILLSGTPGSGKTSIAAHFVAAACQSGARALYFSFEESPAQIVRNMRSINVELQRPIDDGLLRFVATRPTSYGLETHLAILYKEIEQWKPSVVVLDPASNFVSAGERADAHGLLVRLIDHLKHTQVTSMMTNLVGEDGSFEKADIEISSLVDTWLLLKTIELSGERNRGLYVLKSRGMNHSNQIREFRLTSEGVDLLTPYIGPEGVLTGSARLTQEARERAQAELRRNEIDVKRRELIRLDALHREQVARAQTEFDAQRTSLERELSLLETAQRQMKEDRDRMAAARGSSERSDG